MPLQITRPPRPAGGRPVLLAAGLTAAGLTAALAAIPAAASASPSAPPSTSASAGARMAEAAVAAGTNAVIAWGKNTSGELGNGTTTSSSTPVFALPGGVRRYTTVRTSQTSVALTATGGVFGWGLNTSGQIGDGTTTSRLTPVRATVLNGVKVTALREGGQFTMVLTATGKILAWGDNSFGELGDGTTTSRLTPVRVKVPKGVTITAISAGGDSALALTKSGRVLAWGGNGGGQLGDGTAKDRHAPVYVRLPARTRIKSIAAGSGTGYAVTSAGRLLAWGSNGAGQLGDGTTKARHLPARARLPGRVTVAAASAGGVSALALTTDGRVLSWGANPFGQLGNGSTTGRRTPGFVKLPQGAAKIRAVAAGAEYGMALTAAGRILAWGRNNYGQLGDGTTTNHSTPARVQLPFGFTPTAIGAGWNADSGLAIGNQAN